MKEMELSKDGRELLEEILGKKNVLEEVDTLTKKYKQPSAQDVTEMLGKRVTDELLAGTYSAKQ